MMINHIKHDFGLPYFPDQLQKPRFRLARRAQEQLLTLLPMLTVAADEDSMLAMIRGRNRGHRTSLQR